MGWRHFFYHQQRPTALAPTLRSLPHPAAEYLARLASSGAPCLTTDPPWTLQHRDAVQQRGPHRSAAVDFAAFLLSDMYDYVQMGFWTVLPYQAIRKFPALRLVPGGVVPQRERQPRPIMDYSFYLTNQHSVRSNLPRQCNLALGFKGFSNASSTATWRMDQHN
jgi:hypothetical protein